MGQVPDHHGCSICLGRYMVSGLNTGWEPQPVCRFCRGTRLSEVESLGFFMDESEEEWRVRKLTHKRSIEFQAENRRWCEEPCVGSKWFEFNYDPSFSCALKKRI